MKKKQLILMALIALMFTACGKKEDVQVEEGKVEQVQTDIIKKTEIQRNIELSSTLQGYETMSISPSVTGKIEDILVEPGDRVKKGDLLVQMDQMQYKTTKLSFANFEIEMERVNSLKESGAISQQTYDKTKLGYDQTLENLEFLKENTYVKAKFDGVISAKNYEDGELYSGQPILVLTQISMLKAIINIPERNFPYIKKGMKLDVFSEIYPNKAFPAEIEIVYPSIDVKSHTFQVKIKMRNAGELLRPGMYVTTNLPLLRTEAIVVPYQSVLKLTGSNERYVYINDNNVAKRVFVKLGQRFDENVEIISDELKEGMELVVLGQAKLVDGTKMNVVKK